MLARPNLELACLRVSLARVGVKALLEHSPRRIRVGRHLAMR